MPDQRPEPVTIHIGGSVTGQVVGGHHNVAEFRQMTAAENGASAGAKPDQNGSARGIVVADVQASGQLNSRQQRRMRSELRRMFVDGAAALERRWEDLDPSDRGDGLRLVVSPDTVPLPQILDVFLPAVANSLREHVAASSAAARIKLRVAIHFGFLDRVGGEWSGEPLVHAARLADARKAKRILDDAGSHLAVIVSDEVYQKVVRHGHTRLAPTGFRRIPVHEKETSTNAWIHLDLA